MHLPHSHPQYRLPWIIGYFCRFNFKKNVRIHNPSDQTGDLLLRTVLIMDCFILAWSRQWGKIISGWDRDWDSQWLATKSSQTNDCRKESGVGTFSFPIRNGFGYNPSWFSGNMGVGGVVDASRSVLQRLNVDPFLVHKKKNCCSYRYSFRFNIVIV